MCSLNKREGLVTGHWGTIKRVIRSEKRPKRLWFYRRGSNFDILSTNERWAMMWRTFLEFWARKEKFNCLMCRTLFGRRIGYKWELNDLLLKLDHFKFLLYFLLMSDRRHNHCGWGDDHKWTVTSQLFNFNIKGSLSSKCCLRDLKKLNKQGTKSDAVVVSLTNYPTTRRGHELDGQTEALSAGPLCLSCASFSRAHAVPPSTVSE